MKKNLEKSDIYAIYYMFDIGSDLRIISKELEISIPFIKETLNNRESNNTNIKTTSSKINSKNLMITETSVKGNNTVAVMTKAASEVNDSIKKNIDRPTLARTSKNAIFRPNKNKK